MNDDSANGKLAPKIWASVEVKLSDMAIDHFFYDSSEQRTCIPCFISSQVIREFLDIAYEDQFSSDFLGSCVNKICGP